MDLLHNARKNISSFFESITTSNRHVTSHHNDSSATDQNINSFGLNRKFLMTPQLSSTQSPLLDSKDNNVAMKEISELGRPPPPLVDSWRRIDRWAERNYHELYCQLSDSATTADIDSLERVIGFTLPLDVRESFHVHDGQDRGGQPTGILFGLTLLDIEEVEEEYKVWCKVAQMFTEPSSFTVDQYSCPKDAIQKVYAHPAWIPLAKDFEGNNIAVDLAPGPKGVMGQIILFGRDFDTKYVVASSWSSFLSNFADDLEGDSWLIDDETGEFFIHDGDPGKATNYFPILIRRIELENQETKQDATPKTENKAEIVSGSNSKSSISNASPSTTASAAVPVKLMSSKSENVPPEAKPESKPESRTKDQSNIENHSASNGKSYKSITPSPLRHGSLPSPDLPSPVS